MGVPELPVVVSWGGDPLDIEAEFFQVLMKFHALGVEPVVGAGCHEE